MQKDLCTQSLVNETRTHRIIKLWSIRSNKIRYFQRGLLSFLCVGSELEVGWLYGHKDERLNKWEVEGWESVVEKCSNKSQAGWLRWVCVWVSVGGLCLLWLNELSNNKSARTVMRSRETFNSRPDEDTRERTHTHSRINTSAQTLDFYALTHLLTHALLSKQRLNPG